MDGLEAHYALLREAAAQRHALQLRLRSSLPMVWADGALVMNRAAGRRRMEPSQLTESADLLHGDDEISELLEEWRDAGRKRRLEWEVTRRIARVDREMQTKPRAKRFWHEEPALRGDKEKGVPKGVRREKRVSSAVQTDDSVIRQLKVREKKAKERGGKSADGNGGRYLQPTESWKAATKKQGKDSASTIQTVSSMKKNTVLEELDGLEAISSSRSTRNADKEATRSPSPKLQSGTTANADNSQLLPSSEIPIGESLQKSNLQTPLMLKPSLDVGSVSEQHVLLDDLSDADGGAKENTEGKAFDESPSSLTKRESPRKNEDMQCKPSSIGRQVLSDYRTMPSVASFGPGPAVSGRVSNSKHSGHATTNVLNPDVLRRLFSDLDSDRDGHINRIETCLALHRLQITVPAAKISSFFRNVHESTGRPKSQYRPLHEVINFKQFAAFVAAAFDQQRQVIQAEIEAKRVRKSRSKQIKRSTIESGARYPSTSVPMLSKSNKSTHKRITSQIVSPDSEYPDQHETLRYEMNEPDSAVSRSTELVNAIVRDMPDMLVATLLADKNGSNENLDESGKLDAKALVRKSLDRLPTDLRCSDDKLTAQIVQELIKEHFRATIDSRVSESEEDLTGLRRAAAYFEKQSVVDISLTEEPLTQDSKSFDAWIDFVTEEQVAAMIHEIWRENREETGSKAEILPAPNSNDDEIDLFDGPKELEKAQTTVRETADQGIQVDACVSVEKKTESDSQQQSAPQPPVESIPSQPKARTYLGQLVVSLIPEEQRHNHEETDQMLDALRQLRRQRNEQRLIQCVNLEREISCDEDELNHELGSQSFHSSSAATDEIPIEQTSPHSGKENVEPIPQVVEGSSEQNPHNKSEHLTPLLLEKQLRIPDLDDCRFNRSNTSSSAENSLKPSSSFEFDSREDYTSSCVEDRPIFNIFDRRIRTMTFQRRRRRHQRYLGTRGDLSEGEVDPGNVSEGEITGRCRDEYAHAASLSRARQRLRSKRDSDSEGLYSSVESGELDSHVLQSSCSSSRESGELATVRPLLSHTHTA